ncbi:MAG TPA: OmpA family protein [Woeseiaceae bacterium]|nr:OmpA family protein [Woeseiaceae bacterium]
MHRKLLLTGIVACLAAGPAAAGNNASKQETIGVGMGAAVGALAGGPFGFVVGAAIGAKLGDEFHQKDVEVARLDSSLKTSESRVAKLEGNVDSLNEGIDSLNRDLQRMQASSRPELLSLLQAGIEMDLLFRTDEHVLPPSTQARFAELSASLAAMPDLQLRLDGFADERGDSTYNQNLSVQRAEYVRQVLEENGVAPERIKVSAHGESPAADGTPDSYALERRVSLTLFIEDTPSVAANPE